MNHALVKLARTIDCHFLEEKFGAVYPDTLGPPPLPTRLMAGLAILKYTNDLPTRLCASAGLRIRTSSTSAARSSSSDIAVPVHDAPLPGVLLAPVRVSSCDPQCPRSAQRGHAVRQETRSAKVRTRWLTNGVMTPRRAARSWRCSRWRAGLPTSSHATAATDDAGQGCCDNTPCEGAS
jgi:hypothetical protein